MSLVRHAPSKMIATALCDSLSYAGLQQAIDGTPELLHFNQFIGIPSWH
jgi:hypothetical protein